MVDPQQPQPTLMSVSSTNTDIIMHSTAEQSSSNPAAIADSLATDTSKKPVVIGLYGVPGSGKSFLLNQLKTQLNSDHFLFFDGSQAIASLFAGGLPAFQALSENDKAHARGQAITRIRDTATRMGKVAIVAGHLMFWSEGQEAGTQVYTEKDLETYTHILYLDVEPGIVAHRRDFDKKRIDRGAVSVAHLHKWQEAEKEILRSICREHGILFLPMSRYATSVNKVVTLLHDFQSHDEQHNREKAVCALEDVVALGHGFLESMLVIDGDKTLAAEDTGELFWKKLSVAGVLGNDKDPLSTLFSSPLGYSYTAFRQATVLYEEMASDEDFEALCQEVAAEVKMHVEFRTLLKSLGHLNHVRAVIVTCGLRRIWELIVENSDLSDTVKVIGGGRISDGFVVDPLVKAALVTRLHDSHHMFVRAFGDSRLDLPMLEKADDAIVVVGKMETRSQSMEAALEDAIDKRGLQASQVLIPSSVAPRLKNSFKLKLPVISITKADFIRSVSDQTPPIMSVSESNAAKLLMTPMRDANNSGPSLREAHRRVGWYLATELVSDVIGVDEYSIPHVQGNETQGYRLRDEQKTLIVPLMRGGEPMAFGVNDALPLAMLVHAKEPVDLKPHHLQGQRNIILVDSVINTGKSVMDFVQHIRSLDATTRIVIVAGVVQDECIRKGGLLNLALAGDVNLNLISLRYSKRKFVGKKATDTGNRLFNTIHLD